MMKDVGLWALIMLLVITIDFSITGIGVSRYGPYSEKNDMIREPIIMGDIAGFVSSWLIIILGYIGFVSSIFYISKKIEKTGLNMDLAYAFAWVTSILYFIFGPMSWMPVLI